jgi:hypothetical protein
MGLVHSHQLLTQPVTLNRMRFVCQRNSGLPKQLQRFNIELLANDLNKLGFNIPLRDKNGKPLNSDKICNEIYMSKPDVEGMCMLNNGEVSSKGVTELARYFNKYYGTNIPLTVNPMDPNSAKRSVPEVCDDLYLVSDKINRRLADDMVGVKKKLTDSIEQLKAQQRVLDEAFGKHIDSLKSYSHPGLGSQYDALQKQIEESEALRAAMLGELGRQVVYGSKVVNNLGAHLDSRFYPHIRYVQGVLDQYYNTKYDGTIRNVLMQQNHILGATKGLSSAATQCQDALNKLDLSLDKYDSTKPDEWRKMVNEALEKFKNSGTISQAEYAELQKAHTKLLNEPGVCRTEMDMSNKLRDQMKSQGVCNKMDNAKDQCGQTPFCEYDDSSNKCNFSDTKVPEYTNYQGKGGARDNSERNAFWVDAESSDESESLW